ncbi:MAG: helix-turn-helix domain-containing protein [Actinomycetota bacterium]
MTEAQAIEHIVRARLRSLRSALGLSLNEVAARTKLSPSTISRIETGHRAISLDLLVPLANALRIDLDTLLSMSHDDDVVIRPAPSCSGQHTTWALSRPTSNTLAFKMRLAPTQHAPKQRVHPGHDWFFVLEGRVQLLLGDRKMIIKTGEAAEFTTLTPHSFTAVDKPAELIMIFDRDGQRAHVHQETH